MKISQLRKQVPSEFKTEADIIICSICGFDKSKLLYSLYDELSADKVLKINDAFSRLQNGEPLQYITGSCDFMGLEFSVCPGVLIPRFDTETIAEYCIKNLPQNCRFADLCCGSGCIGVSVLARRPDLKCIFADISDEALKVCAKNAQKHGVLSRAEIIKLDARDEKEYSNLGKISALVSNPPYIKTSDINKLDKNVLNEPHIALDGGDDGLDFYRAITKNTLCCFDDKVNIIFEIGYDQAISLQSIAKEHGLSCEIYKDLSENDRMAVIKN